MMSEELKGGRRGSKRRRRSIPRVMDMLVLDCVGLRVAHAEFLHVDLESEVAAEATGLEEVAGLEVEAGDAGVAPCIVWKGRRKGQRGRGNSEERRRTNCRDLSLSVCLHYAAEASDLSYKPESESKSEGSGGGRER
jgi:hypothetical protein